MNYEILISDKIKKKLLYNHFDLISRNKQIQYVFIRIEIVHKIEDVLFYSDLQVTEQSNNLNFLWAKVKIVF